jgi:hypothetical protein
MRRWQVLVMGIGLALAGRTIVAHHAFSAEFDAKTPVTLEGTVTEIEWINPHAWIHIAVKKPNGTVETWLIEAGTPNTLMRRGITKAALPIGTKVKVYGYQAKDRSKRANGRDMTYPDGRKLFLGSAGTGSPYDQDGKAK